MDRFEAPVASPTGPPPVLARLLGETSWLGLKRFQARPPVRWNRRPPALTAQPCQLMGSPALVVG